jgi:cell division protein FtsW (lipid II flippase)
MQQREAWLLSWAGVFISANQLGLILLQSRPWTNLWVVGVWGLAAYVGWYGLRRLLPQHDPYFFPATMLLAGWSLNLVSRLLPSYTERQAAWVLVGLLALLSLCALPQVRWLRHYRYLLLSGGLSLLVVTMVIGVNPSGVGPRLWLGLGGFFFQPSELLKLLLIAFWASYMADHQQVFHSRRFHMRGLPSWRFLTPMLVMWSACMGLLVWQRDFGTATIFFLVFLLLLYIASGQALLLLGGLGFLLLSAGVAYYQVPIVSFRVSIWRDPWANPDGASFQLVQSLMAVADGGLLGSGIGGGIPTFIPVVHTDFAFAAIAEEWGLVGVIGLIGTLLAIILRALRLAALLEHQPFYAYLAAGLGLLLAVQSLTIMGGTLNLIPLTGVTLPLVSYGGSSLLVNFLAVGLLLKLSGEV